MSEKKVKEKKEKQKLNPMMLMMILMLILIVALIGALGYFIFSQKKGASSSTPVAVVTDVHSIPPLTYPMTKEFTVNLSDTDAKRYIKLSITLAFTSTKLSEELKTNESFVRDTVISILSEKKAADFATVKGKDDVKKQIITRINPYLKEGIISDVYFSDILVQ